MTGHDLIGYDAIRQDGMGDTHYNENTTISFHSLSDSSLIIFSLILVLIHQ